MRSALYSMKAPLGAVNMKGSCGGTDYLCGGGFAKTPEDLALLMDVLCDTPLQLGSSSPVQFGHLSLGVVDFQDWKLPEFLVDPDEAMESEAVSQ